MLSSWTKGTGCERDLLYRPLLQLGIRVLHMFWRDRRAFRREFHHLREMGGALWWRKRYGARSGSDSVEYSMSLERGIELFFFTQPILGCGRFCSFTQGRLRQTYISLSIEPNMPPPTLGTLIKGKCWFFCFFWGVDAQLFHRN